MKKTNVKFIVKMALIAMALLSFACAGIIGATGTAKANPVDLSEIVFEMKSEVCLRTDGNNGMRFIATLDAANKSNLDALSYDSVEYGYFIAPATYNLTAETCFGEGEAKLYTWAGEMAEGKQQVIHGTSEIDNADISKDGIDSGYVVRGSVVNMLDKNLATKYQSVMYIKAVKGETTEYKFATAMKTGSSAIDVAIRALDAGYADEEKICKGYIDAYNQYANNPMYSYSINVVAGETTIKSEEIGNNPINTSINLSTADITIPDGYMVDDSKQSVLSGKVYADNDLVLTLYVKPKPNETLVGTGFNGYLGYLGVSHPDDTEQTVILPEDVGSVKNFKMVDNNPTNNPQSFSTTYDSSTKTLTFNSSELKNSWYIGALVCTFEGSNAIYTSSIFVGNYVIKTQDQVSLLSNSNSYSNVKYVIANDIDGGEIENKIKAGWTQSGTFIYGMGHTLSNVTVKGQGLLGGLFWNSRIENIAIKISNIQLDSGKTDLVCPYLQSSVFENVYIEASDVVGNLSTKHYGSSTFNNVIVNCGGKTFSSIAADTVTNLIPVNGSFFDTYSQGLPAGFENSGFEVKAGGLYYWNKKVMSKKETIILSESIGTLTAGATNQTLVFPESVGYVRGLTITVKGGTYDGKDNNSAGAKNICSYDDATKTISFADMNWLWYLGEQKVEFEGANAYYVATCNIVSA